MSQTVSLSDIENVSQSSLSQRRLDTLQNGYDPFDKVLVSKSDPIKLSGSKPYRIIDGRHRIYLARKKGYSSIQAEF